jgi:site-specific DNA-methyltransferase (adenine-specific)
VKLDVIYNEDCLTGMSRIPNRSIDMILCDLPYEITQCRWDSMIPLDKLWVQYNRVIKSNGAIVLFAAQPFTTKLINSNLSGFKYSWVWEKSKATNYLNAKKQPLRAHEDIVVFYKNQCIYNPQMTSGKSYDKGTAVRYTESYGRQMRVHDKNETGLRYPRSVQYYKTAEFEGKYHPTQKPVSLLEYLIKTYTNEGDVVLDNCFGSGSTLIAAANTNRRYIGFEIESKYFDIARRRLDANRTLTNVKGLAQIS